MVRGHAYVGPSGLRNIPQWPMWMRFLSWMHEISPPAPSWRGRLISSVKANDPSVGWTQKCPSVTAPRRPATGAAGRRSDGGKCPDRRRERPCRQRSGRRGREPSAGRSTSSEILGERPVSSNYVLNSAVPSAGMKEVPNGDESRPAAAAAHDRRDRAAHRRRPPRRSGPAPGQARQGRPWGPGPDAGGREAGRREREGRSGGRAAISPSAAS